MDNTDFPAFLEMQRNAHRLLSLAFSRQPLSDTCDAIFGMVPPKFERVLAKIEAEFESTLLIVATLVRAHDDRFNWTKSVQDYDSQHGTDMAAYRRCGVLTEKGKSKSIGLRELCNRILHAHWIYIDFEDVTTSNEQFGRPSSPEDQLVVCPTVTLKQRPTLSKDPWQVKFQVFRFVYQVLHLSMNDEDWIEVN